MIVPSNGSPLLVTWSQLIPQGLSDDPYSVCLRIVHWRKNIYLPASICLSSWVAPWSFNALVSPSFMNEWESCPQVSQFTVLEKARGLCHDKWNMIQQKWLLLGYTHAELTATEIAGANCRLRGVWYVHLVSTESNSTKGSQGHCSNR